MTEKHIAEYFQKSITTPNSFLTDIWSDTVFDNLLVINDFVKHKSNISSNLSVEEIKRICRTNAKRPRKKLSNNKNDEIQRRYSIIINQENIGENVLKIHPIATVPMFNSTWTPEELITDDLLDSFNIPLGKKIQRLNMFYKNSEILYNYLCYYIGSERNVKFRRWFSRKKCFKTRLNGITMEAIGSKAEGLDMKESDTDIMVILDTYGSVPENTAQSTSYRGPTRIQYTSSTQSPGYVCVELVIGSACVPIPNFILQELTNKQLRGWNFIGRITTHGPALAHLPFRYEMDIVPALKSDTWPKIANEWILRERKFGWPSQEMIYNIVKQGCFIVPVGSKINQSNQSEWRLSFNLAEKDLIFSFNHTQLLVYGLLKLVLKEIVNRKEDVSELLCSYFLKTTLFWTIEQTHASIWKPQLIMLCFYLCLERLIQFIADEKCPNYFIRSNNMFAGRFSVSGGQEKLLHIFCGFSEKGLSWIMQSKTMNKFSSWTEDPSLDVRILQKRRDLIEIVRYVFDLIGILKRESFTAYGFNIDMYISRFKSFLKVPIMRTSLLQEVCHYFNPNNILNDNKKANSLRKLHWFLLCSGCKTDLAAGKLILASWLYNNGKYSESLEFANLALEFLKYQIVQATPFATTELQNHFSPKIYGASEVDFVQNVHRYLATDIQFFHKSCILPGEISRVWSAFNVFTNYSGMLYSFLPESYSHFLRFLCLYKLGQTKLSHDALTQAQRVEPIGSEYDKMYYTYSNSLLRTFGNFAKNISENEWTNLTNSKLNLFQRFSPADFEGVNISSMVDGLQHLEKFGIDRAILEKGISLCKIL